MNCCENNEEYRIELTEEEWSSYPKESKTKLLSVLKESEHTFADAIHGALVQLMKIERKKQEIDYKKTFKKIYGADAEWQE